MSGRLALTAEDTSVIYSTDSISVDDQSNWTNLDWRLWRTLCAYESVSESTRGQYFSHIRRLEKAGFPLTFEGLCCYMTTPAALLISPTTIARMRTAFAWYLSAQATPIDGVTISQYDQLAQRHRRLYVGIFSDRGAITWEQLQQVLEMLKGDDSVSSAAVCGLILQWSFAFRSEQVFTATGEHFMFLADEDGQPSGRIKYSGPRHKVMHVNGKIEVETHDCLDIALPLVRPILEGIHKNPSLPVVASYPALEVRKILQRAKEKYAWPEDLNFASTHALRHGAISHAFTTKGLDYARDVGAQESKSMILYYGRTNATRVAAAKVRKSVQSIKLKGNQYRTEKLSGQVNGRGEVLLPPSGGRPGRLPAPNTLMTKAQQIARRASDSKHSGEAKHPKKK